MKNLAIPFLFLVLSPIACQAPASSDDVEVSNATAADAVYTADEKADKTGTGLTAAQAGNVLSLINDICGDTWCEGDFNFDFPKLVCSFSSASSSSCTLTMQLTEYVDDDTKPAPTWWRSCKIKGLHSYASLVKSDGTELTDSYYDKLTDCINTVESHIQY